jgi:aspartyl-tRNA(Asn)/glutamyl-tRNA(Gln) amidotransferase subunit A
VKRFEAMGARVEQADPPFGDPGEIFRTIWWCGAGYVLGGLPEEKKALLDPGLRQMADEGVAMTKNRFMDANAARGVLGSKLRVFMEDYDFILTPSVATTAFEVGRVSPLKGDGRAWMDWTPFSYPFNLTQQPAASIPCGFSGDGLPVGLQIVGRMYDDAGVLAASAAYEAADPYFDRAPEGF